MDVLITNQSNCISCQRLYEYVDILKEKLVILDKREGLNAEIDENNYRLMKMFNKRISELELALKEQLKINKQLKEENISLNKQLNEYGEDEVDGYEDEESDDDDDYEDGEDTEDEQED